MSRAVPAGTRIGKRPLGCAVTLVAIGLALAACSRAPDDRGACPAVPNEFGLSPGIKRAFSLPLNNPTFVSAAEADAYMRPHDLVAGVVVAGRPRAYPWWLVNAYHVVNDTVPGTAEEVEALAPEMQRALERQRARATAAMKAQRRQDPRGAPADMYVGRWMSQPFIPLLVTVCEACKGTAAFVPVVGGPMPGPDRRRMDSSGVEVENDMYARPLVFAQCRSRGPEPDGYDAIGVFTICDMQTHSRWHPFTGVAESGPLAGRRLRKLPAVSDYWENWVDDHPDTVVAFGAKTHMAGHSHVSLEMPLYRETTRGHSTFHQWLAEHADEEDTRLPRHDLVLGMATDDGAALAYRLDDLRARGGLAHVEVGDGAYLFLLRHEAMGLVYDRRLDGETLRFKVRTRTPLLLQDRSGSLWTYLGEAVAGPYEGRRLRVVQDSHVSRWYEWAASHPDTTIAEHP